MPKTKNTAPRAPKYTPEQVEAAILALEIYGSNCSLLFYAHPADQLDDDATRDLATTAWVGVSYNEGTASLATEALEAAALLREGLIPVRNERTRKIVWE